MLYLLRGRMVLGDGCWWRLLASMLPVFPLLHVYAAHDTQLGKIIIISYDLRIFAYTHVVRACKYTQLLYVFSNRSYSFPVYSIVLTIFLF